MKIDEREVLRYLGYKNQTIDNNIISLIEACSQEIIDISKERFVYEIFDISRENGQILLLDSTLVLKGIDIKKHLINSNKCVVMAATLGIEVDSRIAYHSRFNITKGVIMDACATTAIENLCDKLQTEIMEKALINNFHITSRYSPGYGDFSIDNQRDILNVLDTYKKIGLSVTQSSIMLPRKSVTAFIGLSETPTIKPTEKCLKCKNRNCDFRKDGRYCV
ncbi:MAG: hypothetical protein ACI8WT_001097 [Clostridium sp.]|jgi:hypothetical protein